MSEFNYLREKARMIKSISITHYIYGCAGECQKCPLGREHNGHEMTCSGFETAYPQEAEAIVRKWAEEHPVPKRKTRKDVLLEKFPNAKCNKDGVPDTCAYYLGMVSEEYYAECGCEIENCTKCWNKEVEEC